MDMERALRSRPALLAPALALVALVGCSNDVTPGAACAYDSECSEGLVCRAARCRSQCIADRDCPSDQRCLSGGCVGRNEPIDAGPDPVDAGTPDDAGALDDAGTPVDAGSRDSGPPDTGPRDAGPPADAGPPDCPTCVVDVAAGRSHTCVVLADGRVACWGANDAGQLGDDARPAASASPVFVIGLDDALEVAAGEERTCARRATGAVHCWGRSTVPGAPTASQIGDGAAVDRPAPVRTDLASDTARALTGGFWHSCALLADRVQCWGQNLSAELGDGTTDARSRPVDATGLDADVSAIAAGDGMSCAIESGVLHCWGYSAHGETASGAGSTVRSPRAVDFASTPRTDFTLVACGGVDDYALGGSPHGGHCCAARAGGETFCWGRNDDGQLALGDTTNRFVATSIGALSPQRLAAGGRHTCAVDGAGALRCWGGNAEGQLGLDPASLARRDTVPAAALALPRPVTDVAAGAYHTCAILDDGALYCWGRDAEGQLGDGDAGPGTHAPTRVTIPTE